MAKNDILERAKQKVLNASDWKMNISKEDFKIKLKAGEIGDEIKRAKEKLVEVMKSPIKSDRYPTDSKMQAKWLREHIESLAKSTEIVMAEEEKDNKSKFINDFFDIKETEPENTIQYQPVEEEL